MIDSRLDMALTGGVEARLIFTNRGEGAPGGSSRAPFSSFNLASHVGDCPQAVTSNRSELAAVLGLAPESMMFMSPDHGRGVAVVSAVDSLTGVQPGHEVSGVDALVTNRVGIGLVAMGADCVPILLLEPSAQIVGAVHCGWRGLEVDVVGAALEAVEDLGGRATRVQVWLGPAICADCYPVSTDRALRVGAVAPEAVSRTGAGVPALDLRAGLKAKFGTDCASVELVGGCTAHEPQYYSFRRDGLTGRQGAGISLVHTVAGSR